MATLAPYTTFRNIGSSTMFFDFIGQHGAELASGAEIKVAGDPFNMWAKAPMKIAGLTYALDNRLIAIMHTPRVIVFDAVLGNTEWLGASNGNAVLTTPDYGSYHGTAPDL